MSEKCVTCGRSPYPTPSLDQAQAALEAASEAEGAAVAKLLAIVAPDGITSADAAHAAYVALRPLVKAALAAETAVEFARKRADAAGVKA